MHKKNLYNKIELYLIENNNILKINSKDIKKGDVFIALQGKKYHGNRFIKQALIKGARYIISDKDTVLKQKKNKFLLIKNSNLLLTKIAHKKRNLFKSKVIAITGSLGKTSVKENLRYFLSMKIKVSASIKSYNNKLGVLLSIINSDLKSHFSIFEVGTNNFNEIKKLTKMIQPHQVIITNISATHLENFINTRNIAKEKSDLFNPKYNSNIELLILQKLNADEKFLNKLAFKYKLKNIITFGKKESDYNILKIEIINNNLSKIMIQKKNKLIKFNLPTSYEHHIINTIISIIVFDYNNLNINSITNETKKIPIIEGRGKSYELQINKKKITLIDESYNASPTSMMNSIQYLEQFKVKNNSKKFLIFGAMNELGKDSLNYHKNIVISLTKTSITNILFCGEIYKKIVKKLKLNLNKFIYINKEIEIIRFLESKVNNNDIILAKGSNSTIINKFVIKLLKKTRVS